MNLPGLTGHQVLVEIKADQRPRTIPVVILTGARSDEEEIKLLYRLRANCYISKPHDFDGINHLVVQLASFCFGLARLPTQDPAA